VPGAWIHSTIVYAIFAQLNLHVRDIQTRFSHVNIILLAFCRFKFASMPAAARPHCISMARELEMLAFVLVSLLQLFITVVVYYRISHLFWAPPWEGPQSTGSKIMFSLSRLFFFGNTLGTPVDSGLSPW
jgi:hypothetical protein